MEESPRDWATNPPSPSFFKSVWVKLPLGTKMQPSLPVMRAAAKKTVGLVGARGYTGRELVKLLANHPSMELSVVGSRSDAGQVRC